ncbi:hypothetical protein JF729_14645 [Mycobacterium intracellulare]|uniref:hypothetical protein n=1 Tax=Mycobacterium intracellulare TaxID=1767 RepID=UPI001CD9F545|nr:hypothetical protein [Mycobacterium intracellulare]MCA2249021.1 hypothetical protein [Mycobacterium intracellulare]
MAQQMTYDELVVWAAENGKVLVPTDEYHEMCAARAAVITAQADLDRDYRALFGSWRGDG